MPDYSIAQEPNFKDIDLSLTKNRRTRDLQVLTGPEAVAASIENLVNYNFGEWTFQPYLGSNARKFLFENANQLTTAFLTDAITQVIENFEPRVQLRKVRVDPKPDENRYSIDIEFTVIGIPGIITVNMFLNRVR